MVKLITLVFLVLVSFKVNAQTTTQSAHIQYTVSEEEAANNFALIISIDSYDHAESLPSAKADAEEFQEVLINTMGYPEANVITLEGVQVTDANNIQVGIADFMDLLSKDSTVVIYYVGHGITIRGFNQNFIVPASTHSDYRSRAQLKQSVLSIEEVVLQIKERVPEGGVVVFFNACRNSPGSTGFDPGASIGQGTTNQGYVPSRISGTYAFFAAGRGQRAIAQLDINNPDEPETTLYGRVLFEILRKNPSIQLPVLNIEIRSGISRLADEVPDITQMPEPTAFDTGVVSEIPERGHCLTFIRHRGQLTCTTRTALPLVGSSNPCATFEDFWSVQNENADPDFLRGFLGKFPSCQFADLTISERIRLLTTTDPCGSFNIVWPDLRLSVSVQDIRSERDKHPACSTAKLMVDLRLSEMAQVALASIENASADCAMMRSFMVDFPDHSQADLVASKIKIECEVKPSKISNLSHEAVVTSCIQSEPRQTEIVCGAAMQREGWNSFEKAAFLSAMGYAQYQQEKYTDAVKSYDTAIELISARTGELRLSLISVDPDSGAGHEKVYDKLANHLREVAWLEKSRAIVAFQGGDSSYLQDVLARSGQKTVVASPIFSVSYSFPSGYSDFQLAILERVNENLQNSGQIKVDTNYLIELFDTTSWTQRRYMIIDMRDSGFTSEVPRNEMTPRLAEDMRKCSEISSCIFDLLDLSVIYLSPPLIRSSLEFVLTFDGRSINNEILKETGDMGICTHNQSKLSLFQCHAALQQSELSKRKRNLLISNISSEHFLAKRYNDAYEQLLRIKPKKAENYYFRRAALYALQAGSYQDALDFWKLEQEIVEIHNIGTPRALEDVVLDGNLKKVSGDTREAIADWVKVVTNADLYSSDRGLDRMSLEERSKTVQRELASYGYYNGPIDGDFGAGSQKALKLCAEDTNCLIRSFLVNYGAAEPEPTPTFFRPENEYFYGLVRVCTSQFDIDSCNAALSSGWLSYVERYQVASILVQFYLDTDQCELAADMASLLWAPTVRKNSEDNFLKAKAYMCISEFEFALQELSIIAEREDMHTPKFAQAMQKALSAVGRSEEASKWRDLEIQWSRGEPTESDVMRDESDEKIEL